MHESERTSWNYWKKKEFCELQNKSRVYFKSHVIKTHKNSFLSQNKNKKTDKWVQQDLFKRAAASARFYNLYTDRIGEPSGSCTSSRQGVSVQIDSGINCLNILGIHSDFRNNSQKSHEALIFLNSLYNQR